jgi:tetratricopeptide (TPR) repeat protein
MISSTLLDLPAHREEVLKACLRQSMHPVMQEALPACGREAAEGAEAIRVSLEMVEGAHIYVGVFGHCYGYEPPGHDVSITELEYSHAVACGVERMIFLMHDEHLVLASQVQTGPGAGKLRKFKERLQAENVVNFFKSPEDLRAQVINSLADYRLKHNLRDLPGVYVSDVPPLPAPYVAHPYTFMQVRDLVGRNEELNVLTDWVAKPNAPAHASRLLSIVSIGGMGKSALTWKWFNDIAPQEMRPLAGRMWWSFYGSGTTFENFLVRALAYVTGRSRSYVIENTGRGQREDQLLAILDRQPFLLVLDGLERLLLAYARMDANRLADEVLDQKTANVAAGTLRPLGGFNYAEQHPLRKTTDPRVGNFLRKLLRVGASRVLISTRLFPADLQNVMGEPYAGSSGYFLGGLKDDDAVKLWRELGSGGGRDELLRLFHTFDNHPLLVQALASEVAQYKPAPGDFDAWRHDHPNFNPYSLPRVQAMSHTFFSALSGLTEPARKALRTIASLRMPAAYDMLVALLVGDDRCLDDEGALDLTLTELEDRGLLGWNRRANRYDLHPIVRGVVWGGLSGEERREVYEIQLAYFQSIPRDPKKPVRSIEDLSTDIEHFNAFIGAELYDDAERFFVQRLNKPMTHQLTANRLRAELLELFFINGSDTPGELPQQKREGLRAFILNDLATAYTMCGQPNRATALYRRALPILTHIERIKRKDSKQMGVCISHRNLGVALIRKGSLREGEGSLLQALSTARKEKERGEYTEAEFHEAVSLQWLGLLWAARGLTDRAEKALRCALDMLATGRQSQPRGVMQAFLAQRALWLGDDAAALSLGGEAWRLACVKNYDRDKIRARRLRGAAALGLSGLRGGEARPAMLRRAERHLLTALTRAREVNFVEEELPARTALAELRRMQGEYEAARELLGDVWELADRGPYPLFHADALNVLAHIERDAGQRGEAAAAAAEAYRKAWCDGPPFAYHWGLEEARICLWELGVVEPRMEPFDKSKYGPLPDVEIATPEECGGWVAPAREPPPDGRGVEPPPGPEDSRTF